MEKERKTFLGKPFDSRLIGDTVVIWTVHQDEFGDDIVTAHHISKKRAKEIANQLLELTK